MGYGAKSNPELKQDFVNVAAQIDSLIDENPPPVGLTEEQLDDHIMGVILAQHFPLKKGIALFGDKAEQATTEELQAIHDMGTYEPLDASKLTRDEKRHALESLLFIPGKGMVESRVENALWVINNVRTKDTTNPPVVPLL